jgi:hypothetical protein
VSLVDRLGSNSFADMILFLSDNKFTKIFLTARPSVPGFLVDRSPILRLAFCSSAERWGCSHTKEIPEKMTKPKGNAPMSDPSAESGVARSAWLAPHARASGPRQPPCLLLA